MIVYLIKSSICLMLLLVFYRLVLEKEKIHQFNRFFLLGSIVFSFLAPLYIINIYIPVETIEYPFDLDESLLNGEIVQDKSMINYWMIAAIVSIIISFIFLIRFMINLSKIFLKIKQHTKVKIDNATLVLVDDLISPHTFWNYIFINKNEYENGKLEKELLTHELTHVAQRHTIDVLVVELFKIIFWFNPLFYFLKKLIQLNHEFIADNKVIHLHKNISEYQHLLVNKAAWNNDYYLASNLNYSLTKKRLVMMSTRTSKVNNWLKKLAVIPLLTGSIYVFAERVESYEMKHNELLETKTRNTEIPEKGITTPITLEEKENKKGFLASVERDGKNAILKCYNCERWAKLEIPLNKEFTITDWGFTNNTNISKGVYAFTIKVTKNEVYFTGLKNTAWETLGFTLLPNKKQYINQNGMITPKENLKRNIDKKLKRVNNLNSSYKHKTNNLSEYKKLNSAYELLRNAKPHYVKGNNKRQNKLDNFFSKLERMYFNLSSEDKRKTKRPIYPFDPYLKLKKNNKIFYKLRSELTEEDKLLIPPPPPPPNASKEQIKRAKKEYKKWKKRTGNSSLEDKVYPLKNKVQGKTKKGIVKVNDQTIYYITNSNGTTYYNRWGQQVTQKGEVINPEKKFPIVKKGDKTNIPPPPPPPRKKVLKQVPVKVNDKTLYYVKNELGIKYYNRWGQEVNKKGEIINPEKKFPVITKTDDTNIPPPPPPTTKKKTN